MSYKGRERERLGIQLTKVFRCRAVTVLLKIAFSGTMHERIMEVANVIEEMDLFFGQHHSHGQGVDRSITPAFVKEATGVIQVFKVVHVFLTP
jgi:hypothetical protein